MTHSVGLIVAKKAIKLHSIFQSKNVCRQVSEKAGAASSAVAMPTLTAYFMSFFLHRSRNSQHL